MLITLRLSREAMRKPYVQQMIWSLLAQGHSVRVRR
jgi:hypothetical protein